jgi:hypothetical protein
MNRGKLLICPPELSGNSIGSHLVAKQEECGEGNTSIYNRVLTPSN